MIWTCSALLILDQSDFQDRLSSRGNSADTRVMAFDVRRFVCPLTCESTFVDAATYSRYYYHTTTQGQQE